MSTSLQARPGPYGSPPGATGPGGPPPWFTPRPQPAASATETGSGAQVLAALAGAAAVLAGSSALGPTLVGGSWLLPLVEVVLVNALVGIGARMIRLPGALVVLFQVLAMAIALTSLFTNTGIGGVLPRWSVLREFGQLWTGAWQQIMSNVPPAPSSPELAFLIALAVGFAALLVDIFIAEAKAPALVALPLLCLYSVPASIALDMLPWYTFAAPAALYTLLLAVAGHPGRRTGLRAGLGLVGNGVVITSISIVVALVVADSVTMVGTTGRLPRGTASSGQIGLSPFTSLRGDLQRSDPVDLMTVQGLEEADYLRTVALTTWTNNQGWSTGDLGSDDRSVDGRLPGAPAGDTSEITVVSTAFRDRFLPIFAATTAVNGLSGGWAYDSALATIHRTDPVNPGTYRLQVTTAKPAQTDLQRDTVTGGGPLTDVGAMPAAVRRIAQQVTASAKTPFAKALALNTWFTNPDNGFSYSLTVPAGNSGDALLDFLTNKQGYCEQYASAMAVMLRSLGIPTRVAVGFTQGVADDKGDYVINSHDAHAWVEVHFDKSGWVRFDPTPLVDGQGGQQGFNEPAPTAATETATAEPTGSAVVPSGQRPDAGLADVTTDPEDRASSASGDTATAPMSAAVIVVLWVLLGLAILLGVVFGPTALRTFRRRRRLSTAGAGGPQAAAAAWAEIEDLAVDHGIAVADSESARTAANRLAKRAHLSDRDRDLLRGVVLAAEREWYARGSGGAGGTAGSGGASGTGGAAGTGGSDVLLADPATRIDLVGAVRGVQTGLQRHDPPTFFDRWWPRSLRR